MTGSKLFCLPEVITKCKTLFFIYAREFSIIIMVRTIKLLNYICLSFSILPWRDINLTWSCVYKRLKDLLECRVRSYTYENIHTFWVFPSLVSSPSPAKLLAELKVSNIEAWLDPSISKYKLHFLLLPFCLLEYQCSHM